MEENVQSQFTRELYSKSFQFSKIILNLLLPVEACDNEPEEDDENYFTEDKLREGYLNSEPIYHLGRKNFSNGVCLSLY